VPRPSITIITPSLNQGAFIERTLRSVLDQGYERLEYLVLDGGSTDGTVDILRRYDDRLDWWVSEPDRGQTDALNKGLRRATGEVIGYVNSDDYLLPGSLDAVGDALAHSDRRWVSGACRIEDVDGTLERIWRPTPPQGRRFSWLVQPWAVPQPATFWRRELFAEHGPFREDMHYVFDTEFMLRLAYAGELPELLPDRELAVRVLHDAAKSADRAPFEREARRFPRLLHERLNRREQVGARLGQLAVRAGFYR
jgi:glycosyltransferase involved in cell wall biosynthesis